MVVSLGIFDHRCSSWFLNPSTCYDHCQNLHRAPFKTRLVSCLFLDLNIQHYWHTGFRGSHPPWVPGYFITRTARHSGFRLVSLPGEPAQRAPQNRRGNRRQRRPGTQCAGCLLGRGQLAGSKGRVALHPDMAPIGGIHSIRVPAIEPTKSSHDHQFTDPNIFGVPSFTLQNIQPFVLASAAPSHSFSHTKTGTPYESNTGHIPAGTQSRPFKVY